MFDHCPFPSASSPDDADWWARLHEELAAEGIPTPLEELPADQVEAYFAAFPDEAALWTVPEGFTTASRADLARSPGLELTATVEDLLAGDEMSADDLVDVVAAAHRSVNWWTAVRAQATARLAEAWTCHVDPDRRPSRGEDERAYRLRHVEREALRRWQRGVPSRGTAVDPDGDPTEAATDRGAPGTREMADSEAATLARAFTIAEVSLACGISPTKVSGWLAVGQALADPDRLAATRQAAATGLLDEAKVTAIVRATDAVSDRVAQAVDGLIVPRTALPARDPETDGSPVDVEIRTLPRLRDELAAALMTLDPTGARARAEAARATRKVTLRRTDEAMGELRAVLPMPEAARILAVLDDAAERARAAGDGRTLYQRRADALTDLLLDDRCCTGCAPTTVRPQAASDGLVIDEVTGLTIDPTTGEIDPDPATTELGAGPRPPTGGRRRPRTQIILTVPWETVAGTGDAPGTLSGAGPLPAEAVRQFVADAMRHPEDVVWRCAIVSDDHATLLGLGSKSYTVRYRPPAGVRRFTTALYGHRCAFPGCDVAATFCDVDHVRPWPDGPTCTCNGIPLCRPHHRLKTTGMVGVRVTGDTGEPPGTLDWTTATGHSYRTRPPGHSPQTPEQVAATLVEPQRTSSRPTGASREGIGAGMFPDPS